MRYLLFPLKLLLTLFVIPVFFIHAALVNLFFINDDMKRRRALTKVSAFYSKLYLRFIGFKISLNGELPKSGFLIIGNHMSYLDILIYLSFFETLFVTSVEMKERFFIGHITRIAGCLFVERRNPRKLHEEMTTIKKYFNAGFNVCIFPEGTSSNGESVLPFKKSLFQIPIDTHVPIQPIILKYRKIDGKDFGPENCDKVCWYGGLGFFKHLFTLFTLRRVEADLTVISQIESKKFSDRKELSDFAFALVSEKYSII